MATELDSLTIKDFESRYNVTRSNIYNRINGLKEKGYPMEPEKQGGKSVFNADQIALMDALDNHLKRGGSIGDFGESERPTGQSNLSYRTQDTQSKIKPADPAPATFGMGAMMDAIASKVVAILDLRQTESSTPQPPASAVDPLANLRALQEACDRGWLLSSSQLAPLVGLKTLHGKEFERYGFKFIKASKNGAESAWRIKKS
jgi:hypothetical protein